jgi:WD40 repeat protein
MRIEQVIEDSMNQSKEKTRKQLSSYRTYGSSYESYQSYLSPLAHFLMLFIAIYLFTSSISITAMASTGQTNHYQTNNNLCRDLFRLQSPKTIEASHNTIERELAQFAAEIHTLQARGQQDLAAPLYMLLRNKVLKANKLGIELNSLTPSLAVLVQNSVSTEQLQSSKRDSDISLMSEHEQNLLPWVTTQQLTQPHASFHSHVYLAKYSPDGTLVLIASRGPVVRVWNSQTGQFAFDLIDHTNSINTVKFSPDGNRILTASGDRHAVLWNATNGDKIWKFHGHTNSLLLANFSFDGSRGITTSSDNTAKIWDLINGKLLFTLNGHVDQITSGAFSPNGEFILTSSLDRTDKVWSAKDGRLLLTLQRTRKWVPFSTFSPNGSHILTQVGDKIVRLTQPQRGVKQICPFHS